MKLLFLILVSISFLFSQIVDHVENDTLIFMWYDQYSSEYDTLLVKNDNPIKIYKDLDHLDIFEYKKFKLGERIDFTNCIALVKPGKAIFHIDTTFFITNENNIHYYDTKYHVNKGDTVEYVHYIEEGVNLIKIGNHFAEVSFSTYYKNYEMQIIISNDIIGEFLQLKDNDGWINLHDKNIRLGKYYFKKY